MERAGVDQLHLIYLNLFKHLFKYTIHEGLPGKSSKLYTTVHYCTLLYCTCVGRE
jgi:hypothetical protein